ncbi:Smad nuclear-interacting protein 1 [Coemansia spiralis]|nr:Smad nuclear-interacting protein 1 [Coemansia spiralis]
MSSSPAHRSKRRHSCARRRSISPPRGDHSSHRSPSNERRRRRRSKTLPSSQVRRAGNHTDSHAADKDAGGHTDRNSSGRSERRKEGRHSRHERSERRRSRREARRSGSESDPSPKKQRQAASEHSSDKPAETPVTAPQPPREADDAATPARIEEPRTGVAVAEENAPTPDFRLSGRLAAEANTIAGVELKYSEPAEARRPANAHWRIYVFKNGKDTDMHHVDTASAFLFGRDRRVADVPIDHPSCSSQHAVLQYRLVGGAIKPYLMDLASTNGTFLNGEQIPEQRYVELRSEDVVRFGFSTREYVLLRE